MFDKERVTAAYACTKCAFVGAAVATLLLLLLVPFESFGPPNALDCNQAPNQCRADKKIKKSIWQRTADDPIAIYTLALVVFSGALAWISYFQMQSLIRGEETAKASADAAKRAADALPDLERAYVFVEPSISWERKPEKGGTFPEIDNVPTIDWRIVNYGRTPAVIYSACRSFEVLSRQFEPIVMDAAPTEIFAGGKILKSDKRFSQRSVTLLQTEVEPDVRLALQTFDAFLWFYGSVQYLDVFGKTLRQTNFRWRYDVHTGFQPDGGPPYNQRT